MTAWSGGRIEALAGKSLCGFVFKSRSPSSGLKGVKVYRRDGRPAGTSPGLFAGAFIKRFPLLPVADDRGLHDPALRDSFVERIFVFRRWRDFLDGGGTRRGLAAFHEHHRYLIMAHSPAHLGKLDWIVARGDCKPTELREAYLVELMGGLRLRATVPKITNVLRRILRHFRGRLSPEERAEARETFEEYRRNLVPLIVPVVLLRHFVRKHGDSLLGRQHFLYPHPAELRLRLRF